MLERIVIDLREQILAYTGTLYEGVWKANEAVLEFGTPDSLAILALNMMADYVNDYASMSADYGNPAHRWSFIGDQSDGDPWDIYYKEVVHLLSAKVVPLLLDPRRTLHCYSFEQDKLVVTLAVNDQPRTRMVHIPVHEEPPRS